MSAHVRQRGGSDAVVQRCTHCTYTLWRLWEYECWQSCHNWLTVCLSLLLSSSRTITTSLPDTIRPWIGDMWCHWDHCDTSKEWISDQYHHYHHNHHHYNSDRTDSVCVLAMVFELFGSVRRLVKLDEVCIDNNVFRLHYKATVIFLIAFSLLVTSNQYFGDPIDCIQR